MQQMHRLAFLAEKRESKAEKEKKRSVSWRSSFQATCPFSCSTINKRKDAVLTKTSHVLQQRILTAALGSTRASSGAEESSPVTGRRYDSWLPAENHGADAVKSTASALTVFLALLFTRLAFLLPLFLLLK